MTLAFANVFDDSIIQNIQDYIPRRFSDWEALYGKCRIYQTDHFITYCGGTAIGADGGYVYFYRERETGWYYWNRDWHENPNTQK